MQPARPTNVAAFTALLLCCTTDALNALHVANVNVTAATPVGATATAPALCSATQGEGVPNGLATFAMQLPEKWQQRFFSMGVGGNAGLLVPATNATDLAAAPAKGYVTIVTNTSHTGNGTDAAASVRLFLVPGMQHCRSGNVPDQFDTLSAIEAWAEHGKAPDSFAASTKPEAAAAHRLPLRPYPQQAHYAGHGELTDAANWSCAPLAPHTASAVHFGRAG